MKSIFQAKKPDLGLGVVIKPKSRKLAHHIDLFLEECRVQKLFFSGQMSTEEFIGMKKDKNK